jgi:hypothetical protein
MDDGKRDEPPCHELTFGVSWRTLSWDPLNDQTGVAGELTAWSVAYSFVRVILDSSLIVSGNVVNFPGKANRKYESSCCLCKMRVLYYFQSFVEEKCWTSSSSPTLVLGRNLDVLRPNDYLHHPGLVRKCEKVGLPFFLPLPEFQ